MSVSYTHLTPSATVKANSEKILEIVGGESSLDDKQATVEENTTNDTVIFEKNGSGWSDTSSDYGSDSDSSGGGDYSGDEKMCIRDRVCVSAVSSAARTGVWNISVHASPRAIRPLYNLFDFINLYSHYISYLKDVYKRQELVLRLKWR